MEGTVVKLTLKPSQAIHRIREKMPTWSHQHWLRDLVGQKVTVSFGEGLESFRNGTLLQADNFTILLQDDFTKGQSVFFKHAIKSIEPAARAVV